MKLWMVQLVIQKSIMSEMLRQYRSKVVSVIANDGRHYVGTMSGVDQLTNLILEQCQERIYSKDTGVQVKQRGLLLLRGDSMYVLLAFHLFS